MFHIPRPRTAIIFNGLTYEELPPDAELATPEQIAEREERLARQEAQARAIEEARAKAAESELPTVSICGMKVTRVALNGIRSPHR